MRACLFFLFCLNVLLWVTPSSAQENSPKKRDLSLARQYYEEGDAYYKLGQYQNARTAFEQSYLYSKEPLLLLNIGQCYRYLGQYVEAKHSYEAFLKEAPTSPYHDDAQNKVKEMEAILTAQVQESKKVVFPSTPGAPVVVTFQEPPTSHKVGKWAILGAVITGAVASGVLLAFQLSSQDELPASNAGSFELSF